LVRLLGDVRQIEKISTNELKQKLRSLNLAHNRRIAKGSPLIGELFGQIRMEIKDELKKRNVSVKRSRRAKAHTRRRPRKKR